MDAVMEDLTTSNEEKKTKRNQRRRKKREKTTTEVVADVAEFVATTTEGVGIQHGMTGSASHKIFTRFRHYPLL